MKKIVMLLLVVILVVSLSLMGTGCKEPEVVVETVTETVVETVEVEKEAEEVAEGEKVIRIQSFMATEDAFREYIEGSMRMFEEKNPGIKVEVVGVPYGETLTQSIIAASGGNIPDVITIVAAWSNTLDSMGALVDLNDYFTKEELADLPQGTYESSIRGGKLVTMPWVTSSIAVLAWKSVLQEAGLPLEIPATWDEYKEAVRKISDLGDDVYGFGGRTSKDQNSAQWFLPVLWGHGGQFEDEEGNIVLNSPGTVAALEWYKEIGTQQQTPVGMGVREVRNLFAQDKVGFIFDGPWMRAIIRSVTEMDEAADDLYIVGKMPAAADGNVYALGNSHVFALTEQSEVKEEAAELIRFLTQDEEVGKYIYGGLGLMPTHNDLLADPLYSEDPFAIPFIETNEFANSNPSEHPQFNAALEFVATAMQEALLGGDPEKIAAELEKNVKTLYGQ